MKNSLAFSCQHGPQECQGNKVHACSVKHLPNEAKLIDFIHCMIDDNYDPIKSGQQVRFLFFIQILHISDK